MKTTIVKTIKIYTTNSAKQNTQIKKKSNHKPSNTVKLPAGTFRSESFSYNKNINVGRHDFKFKVSKNNGKYIVYILNAPDLTRAAMKPHTFHILSSGGYHICWDRAITSNRDANAIMFVWAKNYSKALKNGS